MNKSEKFLKRHIIDACVKAANSKGMSDAVGVLRGTLILSTEPVSMDQLVSETGYSKSTVSSNMSLLERLGMVRRVVIPGDKRYYYVPVTNPDLLRQAMLLNVRNEINLIKTALELTEIDLDKAENVPPSIVSRIEEIRQFYRQTDKLLDLLSVCTTDELIELLMRK